MAQIRKRLPERFFEKGSRVNTKAQFRFQLAQLEDEYGGMYKLLSHHVHGSMSTLLDGIASNGVIQIPPREPEPSISFIDSMCGLLSKGGIRLATKFHKQVALLRKIEQERNRVFAQVIDRAPIKLEGR